MATIDDVSEITDSQSERRQRLLRGLDLSASVGVEIGALCRPLVRRRDGEVIYVDHTDTQHLRDKYKDDPHVDIDEIVQVDAVWGAQSLHQAIRGRYVDYVVASHVVEHVPDLVTWLRELAAVLKTSGEIRLAVPDRRFTFDYFRRESRLPEVLASYIVRARVPQPYSLLDSGLFARDVSPIDAWRSRNISPSGKLHRSPEGAMHLARDAYENGNYHDVHCWVFTPRSFAQLMADLCNLGLSDLACEDFSDTRRNDIEFSVTMRRSHDAAYIAESWNRMEEAASAVNPNVPFGYVRHRLREMAGVQRETWAPVRKSGQSSALDARDLVALPPDFDSNAYLQANPDVRAAGADPVTHYRHFGWHEGRPVRPVNKDTAATNA